MRGASWDARLMQRPYTVVPYALGTADGQRTLGFLFTATGKERTVVSLMHPREMAVTHYMVPAVLDAGCACWVQGPRSIGNDLRLEHEIALIDVAAGMAHLRALGFEHIVLLGNSGGAGLYAFYNAQSQLEPQARIARTPAGRPTHLAEVDMPVVDGLILLSPHPGQGRLLMAGLDASVVDEADPMQSDPDLDPFSARNGFDVETGKGKYEAAFMERYRAAQRERVARIDAHARALLDEKKGPRARVKEGAASVDDRKRAAFAPIFHVWRTDADLRAWDISIDPSDRKTGSLWGKNPFVSNWGSVGFARIVTPESWLSTWSGLASNAALEDNLYAARQPTLLVEYTGDQCTFPADIRAILGQIAAQDKTHVQVRGNHHGMALGKDEPEGRAVAGGHIAQWLRERFGDR
jgi:hypothetical protein